MTRVIYILAALVLCAGCGEDHLDAQPVAAQSANEQLHREIEEFQVLVETSLVYRSRMLRLTQSLKRHGDKPLGGRDLETLKSGTRAYLDLRENLYGLAEKYEGAMEDKSLDEQYRIKAVMLSLSAALTLYDNYLLCIVVFAEDDRLRRLVNDPDSGFGITAGQLDELTQSANSVSTRQRIRSAIKFYEDESKRLEASATGPELRVDADYNYLQLLLLKSPSYAFVRKLRVGKVAVGNFKFLERITFDMADELKSDGFNLISLVFGNTVGLHESRKGKLYKIEDVADHLKDELQPLDILLEKTPFRITDKFIPGHFGHVAIWVGDESELRALDLWDHPVVKPYHEILRAESGKAKDAPLIVEALRSGVQLSTLDHFLNVDDVAILRPVEVRKDREATREAVLLALRQVGKEYDFNFDVNTTEKIVCSELAYLSFPTISWPTENTLGRDTISPDQVARLAWTGTPLQLIAFYHKGELVKEDQQVELMKSLMNGD